MSKLAYELTNIQLEYEVIHSKHLADEVESNYKNGKRLMYEHVTHHKTISFSKSADSIINESIINECIKVLISTSILQHCRRPDSQTAVL